MKGDQPLQNSDFNAIFVTSPIDASTSVAPLELADGPNDSISSTSRMAMALGLRSWLTLALQVAEIGAWEWISTMSCASRLIGHDRSAMLAGM